MLKWITRVMIVWVMGLLLSPMAWADVAVQGGDLGSPADGLPPVARCGNIGAPTQCVNVLPSNSLVRGFKLIPGAANACCALYDSATSPTAANHRTNLIDELCEDTAWDTNVQIWPAPVTLANGLTIAISGSDTQCIVY